MVQGQLEKRILHHVLQLNQSVSQISIQDGDCHAVTRRLQNVKCIIVTPYTTVLVWCS